MKCSECIKEDKKSIVTEVSTSVYSPTRWDEDGKRIKGITRITEAQYSCSNGHTWTEES